MKQSQGLWIWAACSALGTASALTLAFGYGWDIYALLGLAAFAAVGGGYVFGTVMRRRKERFGGRPPNTP